MMGNSMYVYLVHTYISIYTIELAIGTAPMIIIDDFFLYMIYIYLSSSLFFKVNISIILRIRKNTYV